jgi:hypothetical protein
MIIKNVLVKKICNVLIIFRNNRRKVRNNCRNYRNN